MTASASRTVVAAALVALLFAASVATVPAGASWPARGRVPAAVRALEPPPVANPLAPGVTVDSGRDEPDPFLVRVGGVDYLFTSQGNQAGNAVPYRSGPALGAWGPVRRAMPVVPAWALPGFTWAPDVRRFGNHWVLYFTAVLRSVQPATECIGAAVSQHPGGPYVSRPQPFICQLDHHGSIDARTFVSPSGRLYMLWKSDDNANGANTPTAIWSQPLSSDGLHLLGTPTKIFGPDEPWQGTIVEAPDLVVVDGVYWLFYSGNWFNGPSYAIGVARCAGPLGPCNDFSTRPLLPSNFQGWGPGEPSVFRDAGGVWLLYSPFAYNSLGPSPPRPVLMARLGFGLFGPYLGQPGPELAAIQSPTADARARHHRRM